MHAKMRNDAECSGEKCRQNLALEAPPVDDALLSLAAMAWRASGTRCGRFIFIVAAGTTQTALSKSISFQRAMRSSPGLTNSSAESWSASFVIGWPL
jgi:hypothetical protein